ncbi:MAG TPA: flagellar motor switch protein FliG [Candidatus Limnocylindria bacterium]|jgi:flagellar motor switch protein FliG|nr:flagellar motor switch protein FliG [Candidatus Limnocylindria bacterium]
MISDKPLLTMGGDDHFGSSSFNEISYGAPAIPDMSGPEKAAILMITIGLELAATIFKFLRQDEVERIVLEIAKISTVSIEKRDIVVQEAYQRAIALKYINEGGIEYAKEILERSFGAGQADDMTNRLFAALKHGNPLELVKKTEPAQLLEFIKEEHPQTIALILVYMSPDQAGAVLSQLEPDLQGDVAMRIAILQKTAPEILEQLDELLGRRLLVSGSDFTKAGGVQSLAQVMGFVDRETEKNILDGLARRDPAIAEEVKNLLFVFEDIINLDDRAIQRVLKEVDGKDLALALKTANDDLLSRVYKNMSTRAAATLKDDIDVLGPVRVREVGKAQQNIVDVIRTLEENGQIVIARGGKDDRIV